MGVRPLPGCLPGGRKFAQYPYCFENTFDVCSLLRAAGGGYDTVQIWEERFADRRDRRGEGRLYEREVISCHAGCLAAGHRQLRGPCVPIPMRTGWLTDRECRCDDDSTDVLNCLGTTPKLPPPSPTLRFRVDGIPSNLTRTFRKLPLCTPIKRMAWLP